MASAPAIEKGTPGMASGETEKAIADSEEEEDKTPPREIDISRLLYFLLYAIHVVNVFVWEMFIS